jgi:hypothetical protein
VALLALLWSAACRVAVAAGFPQARDLEGKLGGDSAAGCCREAGARRSRCRLGQQDHHSRCMSRRHRVSLLRDLAPDWAGVTRERRVPDRRDEQGAGHSLPLAISLRRHAAASPRIAYLAVPHWTWPLHGSISWSRAFAAVCCPARPRPAGPDPARSCPLERRLTFDPGRGMGGASARWGVRPWSVFSRMCEMPGLRHFLACGQLCGCLAGGRRAVDGGEAGAGR